MSLVRGTVTDAGGGVVVILVDRDTTAYPEPGTKVTVHKADQRMIVMVGARRYPWASAWRAWRALLHLPVVDLAHGLMNGAAVLAVFDHQPDRALRAGG